jgi:hypothetical protein
VTTVPWGPTDDSEDGQFEQLVGVDTSHTPWVLAHESARLDDVLDRWYPWDGSPRITLGNGVASPGLKTWYDLSERFRKALKGPSEDPGAESVDSLKRMLVKTLRAPVLHIVDRDGTQSISYRLEKACVKTLDLGAGGDTLVVKRLVLEGTDLTVDYRKRQKNGTWTTVKALSSIDWTAIKGPPNTFVEDCPDRSETCSVFVPDR